VAQNGRFRREVGPVNGHVDRGWNLAAPGAPINDLIDIRRNRPADAQCANPT